MENSRDPLPGRTRPTIVLSLQLNEQMIQGIVEQAHTYDWRVMDLRYSHGALPMHHAPLGAIVDSVGSNPLVARLREMGCPVVRVGDLPYDTDSEVPAVVQDLQAKGRLAAEHFAERGFKDVGYIAYMPWGNSKEVYKAFNDRAVELGCTCHLLRIKTGKEHIVPNEDWHETRNKIIVEWLQEQPRPLAVFAYHDKMAAMICSLCWSMGLSVPEDVAVLGQGNKLAACLAAPVELSSIDTHQEEQGRQAVLLLHRLVEGGDPPTSPILIKPSRVVERQSTDVLAVPDPLVARAMRFMWDHLESQLSVDQIAVEVAVSRRKLERAFHRHLSRGVNAELRRKRLERCCSLLRSTDMTIAEVAEAVGFKSKHYLHEVFRTTFGMTPRQYRLRQSS